MAAIRHNRNTLQPTPIDARAVPLDPPETHTDEFNRTDSFDFIIVKLHPDGRLLSPSTESPYIPRKSVTGSLYRLAYVKRTLAQMELVRAHEFDNLDAQPDADKMCMLDAAADNTGFAFIQTIGIRSPNGDYHLFI